ncbi:MAG TPA: PfkB family carbohydrate kinase [Solirubrobacteraceae bacterium]|jgi:fructokinase|nr:PfkB family carbohydrate kinase [Solirubrobacteraceae bacterium]
MSTLCLGEALVDLICQRPVEDVADVDAFVPTFGGAVANVAVVAARRGGRMALAGGAGEDAWGQWLRDRLEDEGVDLPWFSLMPGTSTPIALVTVDGVGEPSYEIYGEGIAAVVHALESRVAEAVEASDALFFSSNTLIGPDEREVTMEARKRALELDRPVIFDPNLRLNRWPSRAEAAATANACVPGALLVRANLAEAALMTGEADPERAASAILKAGARLVVISLGADGAILRGELDADALAPEVEVMSTVGAGDVLTGVLLARLAATGFYPPAVAASLSEAVAEGAAACERWGALE